MRSVTEKIFIRYFTYPVTLALCFAIAWEMLRLQVKTPIFFFCALLVPTFFLLALESVFPLKTSDSPRFGSLGRDAVYVILAKVFAAAMGTCGAMLGVQLLYFLNPRWRLFSSPGLQLVTALVLFELIRYGYHRGFHAGRGAVGRFFWRCHSVHHLSRELYSSCGLIGHPMLAWLQQEVFHAIPVLVVGLGWQEFLFYRLAIGIQIVATHANLDIRLGWLNYVLSGPETHRFHHSTDPAERNTNFGTVFSFVDVLFGTFLYRPGGLPKEYGVSGEGFPEAGDFRRALLLPFRSYGAGKARPT
jgi:sterol desaturase/sphingolipid hydroxylase (fatty acid hydroxylase superfamily)